MPTNVEPYPSTSNVIHLGIQAESWEREFEGASNEIALGDTTAAAKLQAAATLAAGLHIAAAIERAAVSADEARVET